MMQQIEYGADGSPDSMRIVEAPRPVPRAGEILIEVHFAGVNRPDLLQREGNYRPPADASPILGLEVSGRVAALGDGVTEWRVGDFVCALVPGGGYAEYCAAPASHALPIPAGLDLATAAALPETWFTVWINLMHHGALRAGETVLVHGGSSGIGLAAIQLIRHVGARSIVTVGNDDKARFCRAFGADHAINYRNEDFVARVREFTGNAGVDVVLDMVGGSYVQRNLQLLRKDGRLVFVAFLEGSKVDIDLMPVMIKRLVITGSTMRPRTIAEKAAIRDALRREIWPAISRGAIRTHVHVRLPLARACEAHHLMASSAHIGKIVLSVRE